MTSLDYDKWLELICKKICNKMEWVSEKSRDKIPYTTINGIHDDRSVIDSSESDMGINWWTNGFWSGMMWLMYLETNIEKYAEIAKSAEKKLDSCFDSFSGLHHDVGFMWLPTSVANYKITGDKKSYSRGMHAACLLAGRYNEVGKFIRAWNDIPNIDTRGWVIIDSLMNIPLLYWASKESNDPRFKHIAISHADTIASHFNRSDGSSNHIVEFDPINGGKIKTHRGQGFNVGSSWTRGQAWALYGFMLSYIHTHNPFYLEVATKVAEYFISNIPENGIIPIDFKQPKESMMEDTSAAVIAASGMIDIANLLGEKNGSIYINTAIKLLKIVADLRVDWSDKNDCIVTNCSGSYHNNDHHMSAIYADYFFIEAIFKLNGSKISIW